MEISQPIRGIHRILITGIILFFLIPSNSFAQLTSGNKFLGNIIANNPPSDFATYWNQVTPENSGKWGSVEGTRDVMNWGPLDNAYNYAQQNGFPFKGHTLVWGSQEPGWIGSLPPNQQLQEVEEWIQAYAQRYPNTDMIDVVNEPLHAPASFRNALGGSGSTGWDWVVWSFQKARQYLPNATLILNDYGIINDANAINQYKQIINILQSQNLIDGIGIQCHAFNVDNLPASTIQNNLNSLAQTGLPIYVSELDIRGNDQQQRDRYADKFPVFWNHPSVAGVTLWGYRQGETWMATTELIRSNGSERPAMQWLKEFLNDDGGGGGGSGANTIVVRARGTQGSEHINLRVGGTVVANWTLGTGYQNYTASTDNSGSIEVQFDNDNGNRDVQIDYIQLNGTTHQAEDQSTNTGVWQNSSCGGSFSEWIHCNGLIEFDDAPGGGNQGTTIVVRARGTSGAESINLQVNNNTIATWTLSTGMQNYTASTTISGAISVQFTNDASGRDVQVDYVQVNGNTLQAESQSFNTGVWQNGSCGNGSFSEWMHCNGAIGFGNTPNTMAMLFEAGNDNSNLPPGPGQLRTYPNPASKILHIDMRGLTGMNRVILSDIRGNVIQDKSYQEVEFTSLDLNQKPGIYLLRIYSDNKYFIKKIQID